MANVEKLKKSALLDCENALKYYRKIAKDKNASESIRENAKKEIKRISEIKASIK